APRPWRPRGGCGSAGTDSRAGLLGVVVGGAGGVRGVGERGGRRLLERGEQHIGGARRQQRSVRHLTPVRIVVVRLGRHHRATTRPRQVPQGVAPGRRGDRGTVGEQQVEAGGGGRRGDLHHRVGQDRKSTRLNS